MKTAFTMIELIFVIVILGILGGIAVTKLNATRQDAHVATLSGKITAALNEISAYATANAALEGNITDYSNIIDEMVARGEAVVENGLGETRVKIKAGEVADCIVLKVIDSGPEENLTLVTGSGSAGDTVCDTLRQRFVDRNITLVLRGRLAKY